jgi:hypothetical protein
VITPVTTTTTHAVARSSIGHSEDSLSAFAALAVGRGNCPVGPMQVEWGDPVPFCELVSRPRAAKAAIPILTAVRLAGIAALILRRPRLVAHSAD